VRRNEVMIKFHLTGESIIPIGHSQFCKVKDELIIHGRRYRQTAVARDAGMEKLRVMLESATFYDLFRETFPFHFGILSHADKEEQAACDDGDDDNNEN